MQREEKLHLIGQSSEFLSMLERLSLAAPLNRPLLLIGERGTGKELMAQRVHFLSKRWDRPFNKLNCAALPENLLESELFGYESGAFTGATKRVIGRFESANTGTLFLDELGNMDLRLQEKLLRVLEYGEFERLGGRETIKVDVRVVAATNADLKAMVRAGKFRADLLDRLAFDVITLPPLRFRKEDIIPLAEHYAMRMTQELGRECFAGFSKACELALNTYAWPGNVRELKNVIERAVYQCDGERVIEQLVFDPFANPYQETPSESGYGAVLEIGRTSLDRAADRHLDGANPTVAATGNDASTSADAQMQSMEDQVKALELKLIRAALTQHAGNQRKAATSLQLSYHQLRGYLRKYALCGNEAINDAE